jgi:flagellar export protein FliJ
MKRFHFSLKAVATMRAHQELHARELLAASIHAFAQAAERLAASRVRVSELESMHFASRSERLRATDEASFSRAYRRECAAEMETHRRFVAARTEMEKCREAYLEANRRTKVVQRLEQRAVEVYRLEGLKSEQAQIDEIAGRRSTQILRAS